MTVKELERCRAAKGEIESIWERIEEIKSARERVTQAITGMPTGSSSKSKNKTEDLTIKLTELEERLAARIRQREMEIKAVEEWIVKLKPYQQNVIRWRYINGLPWRRVARKTGYTIDGVLKINAAVKRGIEKEGC